jgi:NADPH:quinone reductase-like Zn-dependent oxidoreductase
VSRQEVIVKAVLHTEYGSPDRLRLAELEKPAPRDNEVLVKIHATSVTTADCNIRNFTFVTPFFLPLAKVMFGVRKPKKKILGTEFAGEIEAVGRSVRRFKTGDAVFGSTGMFLGTHAEYACAREDGPMVIVSFL